MKRQRFRKAMLLITFLLFPVTIYYLSPYLIFMAGSEGIASGSFVVFICMFLTALIFGRLFCGWACPAGGLQEACFPIQNRPVKRGDWIKWLIWLPWIAGVVALLISRGGIRTMDFFYQTRYGISVHEPGAYVVYFGVVLLVVILAFSVGRRSFCHHVCWMAPFMILGRRAGNALHLPSLRLRAAPAACKSCMTCTQNCPQSLDVHTMVRENRMEKSECILCGTCVDNCEPKAIAFAFGTGKKTEAVESK